MASPRATGDDRDANQPSESLPNGSSGKANGRQSIFEVDHTANPRRTAKERMDAHTLDPTGLRTDRGYMHIEQYGLIGNMHTAALIATDGGLDYMCWPNFDSPSIFCRLLDRHKGGHFSISAANTAGEIVTKQQYLPSSNILQTMHYSTQGVLKVLDFFPRPQGHRIYAEPLPEKEERTKHWLVRRVECVRGQLNVNVVCWPQFNYARDTHSVQICTRDEPPRQSRALFKHKEMSLELTVIVDTPDDDLRVQFESHSVSSSGDAATLNVDLTGGQQLTLILRQINSKEQAEYDDINTATIDRLQNATKSFWFDWISQCQYQGRWQEVVQRSLLTLKLLTFEPTGAIIAAPTFSLPEAIGGSRNWDYRYSWVRDASFTTYIFLRMGFEQEAEAYMSFIRDRMKKNKLPDGSTLR